MKMEDENAGRSYVAVSFPLNRHIFGEKDDHRVWGETLRGVLGSGVIQWAVKWGKRKSPDTKQMKTKNRLIQGAML